MTTPKRTKKTLADELTPAQRKWLIRAWDGVGCGPGGELQAPVDPSALAQTSFDKVMRSLESKGLMEPYVHGGYILTDDGDRYAVSCKIMFDDSGRVRNS